MPKTKCTVCLIPRNKKYYTISQPYPNRKICSKCINKNNRRNDMMISMLERKTNSKLTNEQRLDVALSFDTTKSMTELSQNSPDAGKILQDLGTCTDKSLIMQHLCNFDLSDDAMVELSAHFYTVACVNAVAQGRTIDKEPLDPMVQELLDRAKADI